MRNIATLCLSLLSLGLFAETQQEVELSLPNDSIIVLGNDTIKIDKDTVFRVKTPHLIVTKIKDEANETASKIQVSSNGESIFSTASTIKNDVEVSTSRVKPGIAIEDTLVISWKKLEWTIVTELEPEEKSSEQLANQGKLELANASITIGDIIISKDSESDVYYWPEDEKEVTITGVVMPTKLPERKELRITVNDESDPRCQFKLRYSDELENPISITTSDTLRICWNGEKWEILPAEKQSMNWIYLLAGAILLLFGIGGFLFWRHKQQANKGDKPNKKRDCEIQEIRNNNDSITIVYRLGSEPNASEISAELMSSDQTFKEALKVLPSQSGESIYDMTLYKTVKSGSYKLIVRFGDIEEISSFFVKENENIVAPVIPSLDPSKEQFADAFKKICVEYCHQEAIEAVAAKIMIGDFSSLCVEKGQPSAETETNADKYRVDFILERLGGDKEKNRAKLLNSAQTGDLLDEYSINKLQKIFKKYTEVKELFEQCDNDIEAFARVINPKLRTSGASSSLASCTFEELWKQINSVNNRATLKIRLFEWLKEKAQEKSIQLENINGLDDFISEYDSLKTQFRSNSNEEKLSQAEIIKKINLGNLPTAISGAFFGKLRDDLNALLSEEQKLSLNNLDELLKFAADNINAPKSDADVNAIATSRAQQLISEAESHSNAEIEKTKQEAEKQIKEANERASRAEQSAQSSKEKLEQKIQEYERDIEAEIQKADQRVQSKVDEYEQKLNEQKLLLEQQKAESEARLNNTIDEISNTLSVEKDAHAADVVKLQDFLAAYIDMIKQTFEVVNSSIKVAYNGPDKTIPLAQMVTKKIVKNNVFSFEDFEDSLNGVLQSSTGKSVAEVKDSLRTVFVNCLSEEMPTWIDVLARLHSYTKVPFIAEQFIKQGLDLSCVATAFQFTKSLLGILDIEITYPELFIDKFNRDDYEAKALRNIESYVEDINSHVTEENVIIDLHTVGFKVNGEIKELPVVSKF